MAKILIKNARTAKGDELVKTDILIEDGLIAEVGLEISADGSCEVIEANGKLLAPGFIDVHVHLREPGFEYKETIRTGTRAAAMGGYTTIFAMPNTKPCPDNEEVLGMLIDKCRTDALIKVGFYSSITMGENGSELVDFRAMMDAGAVGFTDDGKGIQEAGLMYEAMAAAKEAGGIIAAHCEDESMLFGGYVHDGEYARKNGHKGIMSLVEDLQIMRDAALSEKTGARYHICHMSTKEGVEILRRSKAKGANVSGEASPHHLLLTDMDIKEHGNWKMNPPLRSAEDMSALIEGINDGTIECIATDHAPHGAEEKERGLEKSAFGIVGLETAFPLLYTYLVLKGKLKLEKLLYLMTEGPAKLFGLKQGVLSKGAPADLVLIDLEEEWTIDTERFESKGKNTPFGGWDVKARIDTVVCDGKIVNIGGNLNG
ncbi:dihydroorotase [Youngiibacter multivorans]|uniref:Dihydroorotase n=1 Tax=Youngiibacter multivorans TaxID=937251 RepID=A0ABS4FZV5_9CLOT|nr:dihydroorotase [Youngiibacter multivorans]MBP1917829.1 dihydroorotase [Youngiibacter multivorans]